MWMTYGPWVMGQVKSKPCINNYKQINSKKNYSMITSIKIQREYNLKVLISIKPNSIGDIEIKKKNLRIIQ